MIEDEKLYKLGFNAGYVLEEYDPKLFEKLSQSKGAEDYFKGMHDGRREMQKYLALQIITAKKMREERTR